MYQNPHTSIKHFTCKLQSKQLSYLFEGLQQVAARNRQGDVYVVHNEERLFLALVWETGKVVRYKQQHVYFRLLQKERQKKGEWHETHIAVFAY